MNNNAKMSCEEWMVRAGWEGGTLGAFFQGMNPEQIADPNENTNFFETLTKAHQIWVTLEPLINTTDEQIDSLLLGEEN